MAITKLGNLPMMDSLEFPASSKTEDLTDDEWHCRNPNNLSMKAIPINSAAERKPHQQWLEMQMAAAVHAAAMSFQVPDNLVLLFKSIVFELIGK